jgi:hypothetical protein
MECNATNSAKHLVEATGLDDKPVKWRAELRGGGLHEAWWPSVEAGGSVLLQTQSWTDQGMRERKGAGPIDPRAAVRGEDLRWSRRRLHYGWCQGGAALGLCDARGVTPGTPCETTRPASVCPA